MMNYTALDVVGEGRLAAGPTKPRITFASTAINRKSTIVFLRNKLRNKMHGREVDNMKDAIQNCLSIAASYLRTTPL
jgi:hypothetical protein